MSKKSVQDWLLSHGSQSQTNNTTTALRPILGKKTSQRAKTISITSGKGGVGKTSISLKLAKTLVASGHKVLVLDCDYNLSNTGVKLGLPLDDNFSKYLKGEKKFEDCLYRDGNFHLLSAANGDFEIFDKGEGHCAEIINILVEQERFYDFIITDCPAGLGRDCLTLNAYCDYRFIIVTPDKSSITDSYSLMKILNKKYGIFNNHLILNKISNSKQRQRIVKSLSETVENYLCARLSFLGDINYCESEVDKFDQLFIEGENSALHKSFSKVMTRFSEEVGVDLLAKSIDVYPHFAQVKEHEVQTPSIS